jgi:hypothetical protein
MPMPSRFQPIFLLTFLIASSGIATARPWKSSDGGRSVDGDFLKRDASSVTIRKTGGGELTIELAKLQADEVTWLNANHPLKINGPDPSAVFDTLKFGDTRETVTKKLKESKIVETTVDETFFGRSGLNGIYFTRQKIGKVKASLYFDWTPNDTLKELTVQTDLLPEEDYDPELKPTWAAFVELLSVLYGNPSVKGPMPAMNSLSDGTFSPSHLWNLDGGKSALLGTARDGKKYQLVVRFTEKSIQPVSGP